MPKNLNTLFLFPDYATRTDYEARTKLACPPWDPNRPPKFWRDPNAVKAITIGGVPYATYPRIFVQFDQVAQQAIFDTLGISVEEAKSVNIPPTGEGMTNVLGADVPAVPAPMRDLREGEVIMLFGMSPLPMVFSAAELEAVEVGFSLTDRVLLAKIAGKLGVL
jgi:hypothetical protein